MSSHPSAVPQLVNDGGASPVDLSALPHSGELDALRPTFEAIVGAVRTFGEVSTPFTARFSEHRAINDIAREIGTVFAAFEGTLGSDAVANPDYYRGFLVEKLEQIRGLFREEAFRGEGGLREAYQALATGFNALLGQATGLTNAEGALFLAPEAVGSIQPIAVAEVVQVPAIVEASQATRARMEAQPEELREQLRTMDRALETARAQIPGHVLTSHNATLLRERLGGYRTQIRGLFDAKSLEPATVRALLRTILNETESNPNCAIFQGLKATSLLRNADGSLAQTPEGKRVHQIPRYAFNVRQTLSDCVSGLLGEDTEESVDSGATLDIEALTAMEIAQPDAPEDARAVAKIEVKNPVRRIDEPAALAHRAAAAAAAAVALIPTYEALVAAPNFGGVSLTVSAPTHVAEARRHAEEARGHADAASGYAMVAALVRDLVRAPQAEREPLLTSLREALARVQGLDSFADVLMNRMRGDDGFENVQAELGELATQAAALAHAEAERAQQHAADGVKASEDLTNELSVSGYTTTHYPVSEPRSIDASHILIKPHDGDDLEVPVQRTDRVSRSVDDLFEDSPAPATVETAQAGVLTRLRGWFGRNARALGLAASFVTTLGAGAAAGYASVYSKDGTDAADNADVSLEMAPAQARTAASGTTQMFQEIPAQAPSVVAVASGAVAPKDAAQPSAPAKTVFEAVAHQSPNATPAQVAAQVNAGLAAHVEDVRQMSAAFDGRHMNDPAWFGRVKAGLIDNGGFKGAFGLDPNSPNLAPLANATTVAEYFETAKRLGVGDGMMRRMLGQIGAAGLDANEVGKVASWVIRPAQ